MPLLLLACGGDGEAGGGFATDPLPLPPLVEEPAESELPIPDTSLFPTVLQPTDYEVYREGWAELPGETADLYYVHHVTDVDTPEGHHARNFTACYSRERMCPVWVAAPLHEFYAARNVERKNSYKNDPTLIFPQVKKWEGYTRGHLLRSADRLVSRVANEQVFYHTNIAPQIGQPYYFNSGGGAWNRLEDWVDTQWQGHADTLYTVTGCYWSDDQRQVSGSTIPTHYYKVLMRTRGHVDRWVAECTADELQCVAVLVEHHAYESNMNPLRPSEYAAIVSVSELERITGERFFVNVPQAPKHTFDLNDWENL